MKDLFLIFILGLLFFGAFKCENIFRDEKDFLQDQYPDAQLYVCNIEAATPYMQDKAKEFTSIYKEEEVYYFIMITESVEIYEVLYKEHIVALNLINYETLYNIEKKCNLH